MSETPECLFCPFQDRSGKWWATRRTVTGDRMVAVRLISQSNIAALRADNAQLRYALADFLSLATPAKCLASVKWTSLRDHARAALAGEKGKNRTK